MTYTQDWVHNKDIIPHWVAHLYPLKDKQLCMLEIGCFEGMSTVWFLENILTNPKSSIVVIDTFEGDTQNKEMANFTGVWDRFMENTKQYRDKIEIKNGNSTDMLINDIDYFNDLDIKEVYDIIYIDGSHQQEVVLSDAVLAWKLLKTGGIMIFDDYDMFYQDADGVKYEPRIAIDCFYSTYNKHIQRLHIGWQYILKKI